jgi:hypothetical protein
MGYDFACIATCSVNWNVWSQNSINLKSSFMGLIVRTITGFIHLIHYFFLELIHVVVCLL